MLIELLTPPSPSRTRHTQAPSDHAHGTSDTSHHYPSTAPPPCPSSSTAPPIPSRTSHPSYQDAPVPAHPSSSFTDSKYIHSQQRRASYLPNKQINHQLLQPTHILLPTPQRPRIVRRRHAVSLVRPPPNLIHNAVLQCRDAKKARQLPEFNQLEVSRVGSVEALVGQGARVKPLGEVLKICGIALG